PATSELRKALRACCCPSRPSPSAPTLVPAPKSPRGSFPALYGTRVAVSVPRVGISVQRRLDDPVAAGHTRARAVLVASDREHFTPCGSCLDWVFELGGADCVVAFEPSPGKRQRTY